MDTKAHYTLVGLIVVGLGMMIIIVSLWLSLGLTRPSYNLFTVYMNQSVTGLSETSPVKYNGVTVGSVTQLDLNPQNAQQVILTLKIQKNTPVTTATLATLTPQGITGIAYIDLSSKTANAPLLKIHNHPPYPVIPSGPSIFLQLNSLIKESSASFSGVSQSLQQVLDAQNRKNIKEILINLNQITKNMADNSASLKQITSDTQVLMHNAAITSGQLREGVAPTLQAINHFNQVALTLEKLSSELERNPALLVRGRAPGAKGPGE